LSLAQLFGCVRVVWNDALAICKQSEKLPGYSKLSVLLTQSKKTEERKWLADVSSVPLQQSLRNLDAAYRNFFNSRNGKRKGSKMGVPRFKKKTNKQSAEFTKAAFSIKDGEVYLAKIGNLKPSGFKWGKLDLSIRSVLCINCGSEQCRDGNASKNIEMVGMGHRHDLKRASRDRKTTSVANFSEVSRITVASAR
jgi:transposase